MQTILTLKVDTRMQAALKKAADKQFIIISTVFKWKNFQSLKK